MSMLIVICPHCLTWVEPHADRCTECGVVVDFDAPDPDEVTLLQRLGEPLLELGPIRLERRGWPPRGKLLATSEGLLFLPDFVSRPNGAIEPPPEEPDIEETPGNGQTEWSWWPWKSESTQSLYNAAHQSVIERPEPALQRLLNAPGGLFVQRTSIRRLVLRWNRLKIERAPARSVTLLPLSRDSSVSKLLRRLRELPMWRGI